MAETYLPTREADLLAFAQNFENHISADPAAVGLVIGQVTAFTTLLTAFSNAMSQANNPATRTPSVIETKRLARQALVDGPGGIRQLVNIIQAFPGTTNPMRVDLKITVPDVEPTPVPPPTDAPEMDIQSVIGRTVKIRLHNDKTLQRKKPEGVKGAAVFTWVGPTPPDNLEDWRFQGNTNLTVVDVEFPTSVAAGSQVWLTAFWFNTKAQSGPPSSPAPCIWRVVWRRRRKRERHQGIEASRHRGRPGQRSGMVADRLKMNNGSMRLEDEFRPRAIDRDGLMMLRPADAIELVRRCKERGLEVLGIDGFHLTDTTTQPDLDEMVDLSRLENTKRRHLCWEDAEAFLTARLHTDMYFEVVYDDTRDLP